MLAATVDNLPALALLVEGGVFLTLALGVRLGRRWIRNRG
jgi:hypothetical protein